MMRCVLLLLLFSGSLLAKEEPKICLSMVVKNDAETIDSCLNTLRGVIDCYAICDGGSTDNTFFIIEQIMRELKIPGVIYRDRANRFAENEILSLHAAQKTLDDLGFSLDDSYILMLRPNEHLEFLSDFKKNALTDDAYLLLQDNPSLSYYKPRLKLMRASTSWESFIAAGRLTYNNLSPYPKLTSLVINEHGSRDSKILEDNLNDPALTLLDLAQTYKALNRYEDALFAYQKIIELSQSREEVWLAKYMTALCYEEMNEWNKAYTGYLDAFHDNRMRAEPLYRLARYYRLHGQNDIAYLFAKQGSAIPPVQNANLLPAPLLYNYHFDEELSIAAYYTPFREEGFIAANNLLLQRNVPWQIKGQTYQNILFYIQELPNARYEQITPELPLIREDSDERFHPMNPSICKTKEGYAVICRAVNYTQTGANVFNTIDHQGTFRTRNFLIDYSRDFKPLWQKEIVENLPREHFPAYLVEGLEDCRIFSFQNELWFTCTSCDTNPTGNRQISLCKLSKERNQKIISVDKLTPLLGIDLDRCEKNWLPFVKDSTLYTIYSYDPFILFQPHPETGVCNQVLNYKPRYDFSRFRGSAGPLEFGEGYLLLVHEVVIRNHNRCYTHRFLEMDKNFQVKKITKPFIFRHIGVEYCCSMTLDHSGEKLVLPIGIEDREAYLCIVDLTTVRGLLKPLPNPRSSQ
jgi:tetratricopeptide (TPR) repeat protein